MVAMIGDSPSGNGYERSLDATEERVDIFSSGRMGAASGTSGERWLAARRIGFVYWRPGLVTARRVGSPLIFEVTGQSTKKEATEAASVWVPWRSGAVR